MFYHRYRHKIKLTLLSKTATKSESATGLFSTHLATELFCIEFDQGGKSGFRNVNRVCYSQGLPQRQRRMIIERWSGRGETWHI